MNSYKRRLQRLEQRLRPNSIGILVVTPDGDGYRTVSGKAYTEAELERLQVSSTYVIIVRRGQDTPGGY